MFDRFTDNAIAIIGHARRWAERLNHTVLDVPHLALGVIEDDSGIIKHFVSHAIARKGIQDRILKAVEHNIDTPSLGPLSFTMAATRAMEAALMEASSFNSPGIDSGHLLLGVLLEADDVLGEVLSSAGITLDAARSHLADEASEVRTDNTARDGPLMAPPGMATRQVLKRAGALALQGRGISDLGLLGLAIALLEEQQVRPILDALSVNYDALCAELADMRSANPYASIEEAAKALKAAFSAMMQMDARVVAPAHMLIALVSQWSDPVSKVFFQHGVTVARLQTIIRDDPSLA